MSVAGYQPTGRTRIGDVGVWHDAVSAQGTPAGLLRLDPGLLARPGARERLVAAVQADRRLQRTGIPGLLPVADLVASRQEVWLITAAPAIPTVADLLRLPPGGGRRGGPDAGSAATVLAETAQTLLSLHASGLAHGAFRPETIVIGRDGVALLAERGLAAALRGETVTPEQDVTAWATLARGLAETWAGDHPAAAGLLHRAAQAAAGAGLGAARDTLLAGRDLLPQGFTTRDRLLESIHWWSAGDVPTGVPAGAAAGGGPEIDEAVTLLEMPVTGPGETADRGSGAGGMLRFGPGVPAETTAAQIWKSGQEQSTLLAQDRLPARRPPRRGLQAAWSAAVFALIIAGVLLVWLSRGPALVVEAVEVRAPKKTLGCDSTANIVGVISTNGSAGTIRYQWRRSDGSVGKEQTQSVSADQTSVQVPLRWSVEGPGSFKGTATLVVLSPTEQGKPLQDKATFSYKC